MPNSTVVRPAVPHAAIEGPSRSNRLENRIAAVFGAGSSAPGWGNGKAAAVAYARAGARVVCIDRNLEAATETAEIIKSENANALALACDVGSDNDVAATITAIHQDLGPIDILHNNVGIAVMGGPVELDEVDWNKVLDINLTGIFRTTKHVLPHMIEAGRGVITNISSIAAIRHTGYPYASYYASKAAINQFTVGLAIDHARQGIRANVIMPGLIDTPLIYQQISGEYASVDDMVEARNQACPSGIMGTAWDIANAAVFLASDEARYISGVCLPVDGGLSTVANS
jgi:NAD(P)-dependent dehydrogenase (short-subunit alcohol dehydrogenase family)